MSLFSKAKSTFDPSGKSSLQIIVDKIDHFEEDGFTVASGEYSSIHNVLEAGYSITIKGRASSIWINNHKIYGKELRLSVKIDSAELRHHFEHGIIGGAVYGSENHLEAEINIDHQFVRDLLCELRRTDRLGMRIDGFGISDKVVRLVYFRLFPAEC